MDVLPAQASAVACERAFSSSKEPCALRRSRLEPPLLKALQMLKYSLKQAWRLSFLKGLVADEADYAIEGTVTEAVLDELLREGKYRELQELIHNTSCAS
ncbi:hypothetical protein BKA70DRAFT_1494375 [Coprinopsis sp. MPI-PUGE-AT-0042]|nr:hypothetical protein BKA70DRAFT_1494375 [Coprinopsis sp. MPI-PUGE-AT-0042]